MTSNRAPLVTVGSDSERVLTGLGAIQSFIAGDNEATALYPTVFSEAYLEYGIMGLATGLLVATKDAEVVLEELSVGHFAGDAEAQRLLKIARYILEGGEYYVPPAPTAVSESRWLALLSVGLAFIGRFASHEGYSLDEVLYFIHGEMSKT